MESVQSFNHKKLMKASAGECDRICSTGFFAIQVHVHFHSFKCSIRCDFFVQISGGFLRTK